MNKVYPIVLLLFLLQELSFAQLPNTNVVLIEINGKNSISDKPIFLSGFNFDGYNNQPSFIDRNQLLITSDYKAKGLTDVYLMDLFNKKLSRITSTSESEYSPTKKPSEESFSVVRQEVTNDPNVPQYLWKYPMDGSTKGKRLVPKYQNIGYHCWLPENLVALFLVGEPHKLILVNMLTNKETFITYNVGRCLKYDNKGNLYYVLKMGSRWTIKRYNLSEDRSELITTTLPDSEDFEILPNGDLISGKGAKLYIFDMETKGEWQEVADYSTYNIRNISRIAAKDNKIALVTSS